MIKFVQGLLLCSLVLIGLSDAKATKISWTGAVNDEFHNPANWTPVIMDLYEIDTLVIPGLTNANPYPVIKTQSFVRTLILKPGAVIHLQTHCQITKSLIMESSETEWAQYTSNGNGVLYTVNLKIWYHLTPGKWRFVAFPFDSHDGRSYVINNGKLRTAVWGSINNPKAEDDFYVVRYNGAKRFVTAASNAQSGQNWEEIAYDSITLGPGSKIYGRPVCRGQGYLITPAGDQALTVQFNFYQTSSLADLIQYNFRTNHSFSNYRSPSATTDNVNASWNLAAPSFLSDYYSDSIYEEPGKPLNMYFYNPQTCNYEVINNLEARKLPMLTPFFYQATGPLLKMSHTSRIPRFSASPAAVVFSDDQPSDSGRIHRSTNASGIFLDIGFQYGAFMDRTVLGFRADATADYRINEDAVKMMSPRMDIPQCWTLLKTNRLAINVFPDSAATFLLGYRVGAVGSYRFFLQNKQKLDPGAELWLTDAQTGKQVNLMKEDYYFNEMKSGESENRFRLHYIPFVATGGCAESVPVLLETTAGKGFVVLRNCDSRSVCEVSSLSGVLINRLALMPNTDVKLKLPPGIYVLRWGTKSDQVRKIAVL